MERQYESELGNVRHQLVGLERNRLHPHRHELFWNAAKWRAAFEHLIACEQRRDSEYIQNAASVPVGSAEALCWLQALYDAVEYDISWHQWLLDEVQAKQQRAAEQMLAQPTQQELLDHEHFVAIWLQARCVRLNQVALEFLEGRRRELGTLPSGVWQGYWTQLQQVTQLQSQQWRQSYDQPLPQADVMLGLSWYKHLRDLQEATNQIWRAERSFDRTSWQRDRALVDNEIKALEPRPRLFGLWLVVAAVGCVVFYFANPLSGEAQPLASTTVPSTMPMTVSYSAPDVNEQGLVLLVRGDCTAAMPLFRQAAALDPTFYQPPNNLAFCLFDQGDVPAAIDQWRRSIELNSANADGHAGLGMALYLTGLVAEGQVEYETAVRLNPKYGDEEWLRNAAKWSEEAISASKPLRLQASR